jgi:hypothetical protein
MRLFPLRIELPNVMTVQCAHHANPREHRRTTTLANQYQRLVLADPSAILTKGVLHHMCHDGRTSAPRATPDEIATGVRYSSLDEYRSEQQQEECSIGLVFGRGSVGFGALHDGHSFGCAYAPLSFSTALLQDHFEGRNSISHGEGLERHHPA